MSFTLLLCALLASSPAQPEPLTSYASMPHLMVQAELIGWQGQRAVSKTGLTLNFDRARGWLTQRDEPRQSRYDFKDAGGCHRAEVSRQGGLSGTLEQRGDFECVSGGDRSMGLGIDPVVSLLNLLEGSPDALIAADRCQATPSGLSCAAADGSAALIDIEAGRIQRMLLQRASWATLETVEFTYIDTQPGSRELRVDAEIAGALPEPSAQNVQRVFQAALGKSKSALAHALAYLRGGILPEGFSEAQLSQVLEHAYAARISGAAKLSAQLYAKSGRDRLPATQRARGDAALTLEFFKRMAEAAASCEGGVVSDMEAECMQVVCKGNRAIAGPAMEAYQQETETCEARISNPFPELRRPAWANRALPSPNTAPQQ